MVFSQSDRTVLRDLALEVADIAALPEMARRRRLWVEHNSLRSRYPMMLVFPEGSWVELLPESALRCADPAAREIEEMLRRRIYGWKHFQDDTVVEREWVAVKRVSNTGWGLAPRRIPSPTTRGSYHIDPVIKVPADLKKLRMPEVVYDEKRSLEDLEALRGLFGDILEVRPKGMRVGFHMLNHYTALRGLEECMMDMYAEPEMLHEAMRFMTEGNLGLMRQYADMNLLAYNNDNSYQGSGGNGYTDQLPAPGADPARVRYADVWGFSESQELAQVSPEHHVEFALQYEKQLLAPFGLNNYGCCEDLTRKLDDVLAVPNMRRISISPWADVDACAARLRGRAIYSWKPNPAHLVGDFNAVRLRDYVRHAVQAAKTHGCFLEMVLKDTHTCEQRPERFDGWTRVAREVIAEEAGPAG
jgi:hypothetical protein